jgi:hypothetical protein
LGDKFDCIRLIAVDGVEEHVRPGDAFVDNTATGVTNDETTIEPVDTEVTALTLSEEELVGKMQTIIQFFLDLIQVTVGDLAPEKRVWFLICQIWKNNKGRLLTMKESHGGIEITSRSTGTVSGVKCKAPEEGQITLGFQISVMVNVMHRKRL